MKLTRDFTPNQWKWIVLGVCDILLGIAVLIIRDDPIGMRGAEYLMVMLVLLSYEPDHRRFIGPRGRRPHRSKVSHFEARQGAEALSCPSLPAPHAATSEQELLAGSLIPGKGVAWVHLT